MEKVEEQFVKMKKKKEQLDIEKSIKTVEKLKNILDDPSIKPIFDKDNNVIEEFNNMLKIFNDEIKNAKHLKEEIKSELSESSMHLISRNFDYLEKSIHELIFNENEIYEINIMSRKRKVCDTILRFIGCLFSGSLSCLCIISSIRLAETNILMSIPIFLGGCLLAGATCAMATGNNVDLPDFIEGMKLFGGKKKMRFDRDKISFHEDMRGFR